MLLAARQLLNDKQHKSLGFLLPDDLDLLYLYNLSDDKQSNLLVFPGNRLRDIVRN